MTSLYNQSIPIFSKYLKNLSGLLEKGVKHADEKSIKHDEIIEYRLISDLRGLAFQVQCCCNAVVNFADRVGELEHAVVEDNETTFEELQERINKTIAYLAKVEPKALDDKINTPILMEVSIGKFEFKSGQAYLSEYAIPFFHFHLTTAYCLLRTQGVDIGAMDYLKDVFHKV